MALTVGTLFAKFKYEYYKITCKLLPVFNNKFFLYIMMLIPVLIALVAIIGGILLYTTVLNIPDEKRYKIRKYANRSLIGFICLYIWILLQTSSLAPNCHKSNNPKHLLNPDNDEYARQTLWQNIKWFIFSPNFLLVIYGLVYMALYTNIFTINKQLRRQIRKYFEPIFIIVSSVLICGVWLIVWIYHWLQYRRERAHQ